jgi:hypothetical protein
LAPAEEKGAIAEDLIEEEPAAFDVLIKLDMKLARTADNRAAAAAQDVARKLRAAMPVLDWHGQRQNRAQAMARI